MSAPALPRPSSSWQVTPSGAVYPLSVRRPRPPFAERICETCGRPFTGNAQRRFCGSRCTPSQRPGSSAYWYQKRREAGLCADCSAPAGGRSRCVPCKERRQAKRRGAA